MGNFDFNSKKVDEAFRAGNRARKKEAVADTVEGPLKQIPFTGKEISDAFRAIIDSEDNPIRKNVLPGYEDNIKPAVMLTMAARYSCEAFRKLFSRVMEGPWGKLKITWEEWRDGRRWGGWMELGVVKVLISRDDFKDGTPVKVWRFPLRIDGDFEDDNNTRFGVFAGFDAVENLNVEMHRPIITVHVRHSPYKIYADQSFVDGLNRFFSYEIWEAFRAGNRARKKETVADTAGDNISTPVHWENKTIGKFMSERGIMTVEDCEALDDAGVSRILWNLFLNTYQSDLVSGGPMKFNELRYFTGWRDVILQDMPEFTEITLPEGVEKITKIGGLDTDLLVIPSTVKKISSKAFTGLNARAVKFAGSPDGDPLEFSDLMFGSNKNIVKVRSERPVMLREWAFAQCQNLKSFWAPDITCICDLVFLDCPALESVGNMDMTYRIGNYAFSGCERLRSIKCMSPNLEEVGKGAFSNCTALETVELSATDFGDIVFSGCKSLKRISMPEFGDTQWNGFSMFSPSESYDSESLVIEVPENMADIIRRMRYLPQRTEIVKLPPVGPGMSEAFHAGNKARKRESAADSVGSDMFSAVPGEPADLDDFMAKLTTYLDASGLKRVDDTTEMLSISSFPENSYCIDYTTKAPPRPEYVMIRPAGSVVIINLDLFESMADMYIEEPDRPGKPHRSKDITKVRFVNSRLYGPEHNYDSETARRRWVLMWRTVMAYVKGEISTVGEYYMCTLV